MPNYVLLDDAFIMSRYHAKGAVVRLSEGQAEHLLKARIVAPAPDDAPALPTPVVGGRPMSAARKRKVSVRGGAEMPS